MTNRFLSGSVSTIWTALAICCCLNSPVWAQEAQKESKKQEKQAVDKTSRAAATNKTTEENKPDESTQDAKTPNPKEEKSNIDSDGDAKSSDPESSDELLAGHSYHGAAFNEGPRQSAFIMGGTGNVGFPASTEIGRAQAYINQGVGQLHGFWFLEAERSFRQAASIDPECAIAYWGCAMANTTSNSDRAKGFIEKAMERIKNVTPREKMYIEALNRYLKTDSGNKKSRAKKYVSDLEKICIAYPGDVEAKAFVVHRIWENVRQGVPISSHLAAESLLKEIFRQQPMHPAHHYRIHLWDHESPEQALQSAARCGLAAPQIAHMWHMPGHIYSRLKRYEDAIYQQEASARVDHANMMRDHVLPDEIHNFAHNNEWLIRNMVFVGRVHDALSLANNMIELPRHPKYNTMKKRGSAKYGIDRLQLIIKTYQLHELGIEACLDGRLPLEQDKKRETQRLRLLGSCYAMTGQNDEAKKIVSQLSTPTEKEKATLKKKIAELKKEFEEKKTVGGKEKATNDDLKKAIAKLESEQKVPSKQAKSAIDAINGRLAMSSGDYKKARELLKKANGEDASLLAELRFLAGEKEQAIADLEKDVQKRKGEVVPLARLVYVLYHAQQKTKSQAAFEELRELSGSIDLDIELFARLKPIAVDLGYRKIWAKDPGLATDIEFRPALNGLGPFRWSAPEAPKWEIVSEHSAPVSSATYQGQPHILIFYLGHGCLHCAEQLQAFGPKTREFEDAGLKLHAVSSDDQAGLKQSIADYEGDLPIPLVADPKHEVFKQFRAFDDFENQPLHGTFLISGDGKVLWQDIGHEPFMDPDFVLAEAQRLLKLTKLETTQAAK